MEKIKNIIFDYGNVIFEINFKRTQDALLQLGISNPTEFYGHRNQNPIFDNFEMASVSADEFRAEIRKAANNLALTDEQIANLTKNISIWAEENFSENEWANIFVKSSTGFYETKDGKPNGATFEGVKIMLDNAGKLPVKAAGGVRTPEDAEKMINMGVKRIGTSSALALMKNQSPSEGY